MPLLAKIYINVKRRLDPFIDPFTLQVGAPCRAHKEKRRKNNLFRLLGFSFVSLNL